MQRKKLLVLAGLLGAVLMFTAALTQYNSIWVTNSQVDSTVIGSHTAASAAFTTAAASSGFTGNLTGTASNVPWTGVTSPPYPVQATDNWGFSGQSGQPTWLWGTADGLHMLVWSPSNFSVNNSTHINGGAMPVSAIMLASNSSGQPIAGTRFAEVNYVIDGGGSAITTGSKGFLQVPCDQNGCTLYGWTVFADQVGSISVSARKGVYTSFPSDTDVGYGIVVSGANHNGNWGAGSVSLTGSNFVEFYVNSASTMTRATVVLRMTIP